jgi:hypothetical protein
MMTDRSVAQIRIATSEDAHGLGVIDEPHKSIAY